jgi:GLPGLI family protein
MKYLLKISLLLFSVTLFSQEFTGKVEYQTIKNEKNRTVKKNNENSEKENAKDGLSEEELTKIKETIKKAFQKKYELTFNKNEAVFEEILELDQPKPAGGEMSFSIKMSGVGKKYINTKDKIFIEEEDLMDEEFLVEDSLQKIDWILSDETKVIGDYTCQKATYIIPVSKIQKNSYNTYLEKIEKGEKPLFEMKKPEPTTVIAWYTTEIPVSFGPSGIWGLPGLILQLEDARLIYLCTKVSLKNNEKTKIKIPNQGKIVTKKEFEKYQEKLQKRMDDNGGAIFTTTKE